MAKLKICHFFYGPVFTRDLGVLWTASFINNFCLFQLGKYKYFYKNVDNIFMVSVQKITSGKKFKPYHYLKKECCWEENIHKQRLPSFESYILTVVLSTPFNKLPWKSSKVTTGLKCKNLSQYQKVVHFQNMKFRTTLPQISWIIIRLWMQTWSLKNYL